MTFPPWCASKSFQTAMLPCKIWHPGDIDFKASRYSTAIVPHHFTFLMADDTEISKKSLIVIREHWMKTVHSRCVCAFPTPFSPIDWVSSHFPWWDHAVSASTHSNSCPGKRNCKKKFREHNRRRREPLLNLARLQRTLSTRNGQGRTKIHH
jgi:hypothetical protein